VDLWGDMRPCWGLPSARAARWWSKRRGRRNAKANADEACWSERRPGKEDMPASEGRPQSASHGPPVPFDVAEVARRATRWPGRAKAPGWSRATRWRRAVIVSMVPRHCWARTRRRTGAAVPDERTDGRLGRSRRVRRAGDGRRCRRSDVSGQQEKGRLDVLLMLVTNNGGDKTQNGVARWIVGRSWM